MCIRDSTNLTIEDLFGNYRYYLEANWIKEWGAGAGGAVAREICGCKALV